VRGRRSPTENEAEKPAVVNEASLAAGCTAGTIICKQINGVDFLADFFAQLLQICAKFEFINYQKCIQNAFVISLSSRSLKL